MNDDQVAAFHCQTGANTGLPHQWTYLKPNYRCVLCLVVFSKARLKELTDNA